MGESFEERVRGLMSPLRSGWLRMPSAKNRRKLEHHIDRGLYHFRLYCKRLDGGHRHRASKHLRCAIAHWSRGLDRASGEYYEQDFYERGGYDPKHNRRRK